MKNKRLTESTDKQLNSKKKSMQIVLIIISSLIVLYSIYFVYKLATKFWEANNTLGIVAMGMLVIVISTTSVQYSSIVKELKKRNEEI